MTLQRETVPDRTLPIHPTQIYSSLNALLLMAVVLAFDRQRWPDGSTLALTLTLYPVTRFQLEVIRDDEAGAWGTHLTISQWISLFVLAAAVALWCFIGTRSRDGRQDRHGTDITSRKPQIAG